MNVTTPRSRTLSTLLFPRSFAVFVLVLVSVVLQALPTQTTTRIVLAQPNPPDHSRLVETARREGFVRVIVELRTPFQPEGLLPDAATREQQRNAIARARQDVLQQLKVGNVRNGQPFEAIPFMALHVDAAAMEALARNPNVVDIAEDVPTPPALAESVKLIGGSTTGTFGDGKYTGNGWTVAVLDTGVSAAHSFFNYNGVKKVVAEACYSSAVAANGEKSFCPGGASASTAVGSGTNCPLSWNANCDHGTHVAGIVAGTESSFSGVAKNAKLIAIQVFTGYVSGGVQQVGSYASDQIRGLERVLWLHNNTSMKIAAANMSLGGGKHTVICDTYDASTKAVKAAIDNLRSKGIATIIASGNNGYKNALSAPACISTAISVGSTTTSTTNDWADVNEVSSFSNSASFLSLLAPGDQINSAVPGNGFTYKPGTSMATPHVAGAWAVLKQAKATAGVPEILSALQGTGLAIADSNGITKRRITLSNAANRLGPICRDASKEPANSTPGGAIAMGLPSTHKYAFCTANDKDWFKWSAAANVAYTLRTLNLTTGTNTVLEIYKSTDLVTPIWTDAASSVGPSTYTFTPTAAGTYYARVYNKSNAGNFAYNYDLSIVATSCRDASKEPANSTPGGAIAMGLPSTHKYAFCATNDKDWFKWSAVANVAYTLRTLNLAPGVDTVLAIYKSTDLVTPIWTDAASSAGASAYTFTPTAPGTYYARVHNKSNAGNIMYTYDLSIVPNYCNAFEPNNTKTAARLIGMGTMQRHAFCKLDDADWSTFTAVVGATYRFEVSNVASDVAVGIYIYEGENDWATDWQFADATGQPTMKDFTATSAGPIWLELVDYIDGYGADNNYSLKVTRIR